MKKIVASVGLVALSASGLQAQSTESAKPWSVSATLRGFYDDNVTTTSGAGRQSSFGFQVSPSIGVGWDLQQTTISLNYTYQLNYYEKKPAGNADNYDQTHIFLAALTHAFSPRYNVVVQDSFVIGQEPDLLRTRNTALSTFQRIPGDNIRNDASIIFNAKLTKLFGLEAGYQNVIFDYADSGEGFIEGPAFFDPISKTFVRIDRVDPSHSGLLDRIEHTIHLDGRWKVQPETDAVVGYSFSQVNYTGNELIAGDTLVNDATGAVITDATIKSESRDLREHRFYVGVDHTFPRNMSASVRVGARYAEYYKDPAGNGDGWGPFAQGSLQWNYAPESNVQLGVRHDLSSTDIAGTTTGSPGTTFNPNTSFTQSAESTVIFGSVEHRITPMLFGSLTGQFQNSSFNGGTFNSESERYFLVGLNLEYRFNPHFSADVGYNYDRLDSDVGGRSFDRNRVYMGVKARY